MQKKVKLAQDNSQKTPATKSNGVVVVEIKKHKDLHIFNWLKSKPSVLIVMALIFALVSGAGLYLYLRKNGGQTSVSTTISNEEVKSDIKKSLNNMQNKIPPDSASVQQKQAFYEEYFEKLITVGDTKKVIDVYTTKVAPIDLHLNRDLQDEIADTLLANGKQALAKNIYIDSLAQAQKELANASQDNKPYIEAEISVYKSRIGNL